MKLDERQAYKLLKKVFKGLTGAYTYNTIKDKQVIIYKTEEDNIGVYLYLDGFFESFGSGVGFSGHISAIKGYEDFK